MEYTNSQMLQAIREHCHSLRDRRILESRLIDGMTFDALSAEYELSVRQVKNIVYHNEKILFRHLKPP